MKPTILAAVLVVSASALAGGVEVGANAPFFSLKDVDGKVVKLTDFKGQTVVLEWFNPACPFVKASHTKGSLVDTAKRHMAKGVVWLSINSGAEGKQGTGAEVNREGAKSFAMTNPVLLDWEGNVGRWYGATNTPHLFIIDRDGKIAYRGAPDNSPDGEGASPSGGTLVNYVDAALADLAAGKPVKVTESKAYGCSVKYAK